MFEQYKKQILSAKKEWELERTIELASFCDEISYAQFCELYSLALIQYHKIYD